MIKQTSLSFLRNLKENNSKECFENNKISFQEYRVYIIEFAEELLKQLFEIDPAISVASLDAETCLTRVSRDLGFSKHISPCGDHV